MTPRPHPTLRRPRLLLMGALAASMLLAACEDEPAGQQLTPVTSGTIGGIPFTVRGGTVYQFGDDGPLFADESGGEIVFDEDPVELGMSDPDLLHVRTYFAVSQEGSLGIAAFGEAGSPFDSGVRIDLSRDEEEGFVYELRVAGALLADSSFASQPPIPSGEQWIVAELYADSIPGFPAGEAGAALWPLNDLTPSAAEDVLGCGLEPAADASPRAGDAVGFALVGAWLLDVEVHDQIAGPCT